MFKIYEKCRNGKLNWLKDEENWKDAKAICRELAGELSADPEKKKSIVIVNDAFGKTVSHAAVEDYVPQISHHAIVIIDGLHREAANYLLDLCYGAEYRGDEEIEDLRFQVSQAYKSGNLSHDEIMSVNNT